MPMNPGMKMMMLQRMTDKPRQQSEYGGNRRMIGYDRNEMTGGANRNESNYGGGNRSEYNRGGGYDRSENTYRSGGYPEGNGGNRYEYGGGNRYEYGGGASNRYESEYRGGYEDNYGGGYESPENRRRRSRRTGRFVRGAYGGMDDDDEEMDRDYPPRMMHGNAYGDVYAKGTIYAPGAMNRHGGNEQEYGEVDEHKARKWVRDMSGGEVYKVDQTEPQRQAVCPDCDKWEFYVAMNAAYSDHCKTAKKINMDRPEFYAMLARDFLEDEDAGPHKLEKYMETIPKK